MQKTELILGGETLVGRHSGKMLVVVGLQVSTQLRRDFGPLIFTKFLGCCFVTQRFSIGLRSGHSMTLMWFLL